ncbi:hypothetical protein [Pectobacterium carotovorum]|uniref:hypothetical protein n=1 Tax=Pectobacterium carotovorum TaxID=554 RepID=UPI0001A445DD|nr:hypothetical protein [Pectobacterium carotovorum]KHT19655.1 hypothetical protein RC96_09125 [Pectobacterium carotovorum subsp. carotovorum]
MRPVLFLSQNLQESNHVFFLWLVRNVLLLPEMGKWLFPDTSVKGNKKKAHWITVFHRVKKYTEKYFPNQYVCWREKIITEKMTSCCHFFIVIAQLIRRPIKTDLLKQLTREK